MEPSKPASKRTRTSDGQPRSSGIESSSSLTAAVSPPRKRNRPSSSAEATDVQPPLHDGKTVRSPIQLTRIQGLPQRANADSVTLKDLIGDPLIRECWEFNYLHDIDFLMESFDEDIRHLVKVHVVHGFWKREDPSRAALQNQASRHSNVELHAAYLPEMFGTHHTKMLLLLRHDDTAQVIIHTANMIVRDWRNMTQGVWCSPRLPLLKSAPSEPVGTEDTFRLGSGQRFKRDLLSYLEAYDDKRPVCRPIIQELTKYDFSEVRGSLIASVPGRHNAHDATETQWGWSALKQALREVPVNHCGKPEIVIQISSIATLGPTDTWLRNTLFSSLSASKQPSTQEIEFNVVFPTPDEIRRSLDGYGSGASIHTKIQSSQQAKQLDYLRPLFCHWANDSTEGTKIPSSIPIREAGRKRAAPHIKTYIRYAENSMIDWALLTSANLSKQAWGEPKKPSGEFRISSYEIGVLVWPSLYAEDAAMIPTFQTDSPMEGDITEIGKTVVGLRVPYNLPLQKYSEDEVPWVATMSYEQRDWMGQTWQQH